MYVATVGNNNGSHNSTTPNQQMIAYTYNSKEFPYSESFVKEDNNDFKNSNI